MLIFAAAIAFTTPAVRAEPVAVTVGNASLPEACAENDNVTLTFSGADVRRFTVTALHPAYIGTLQADRTAPDWTACGRGPGGAPGGALGAPPPAVPSRVIHESETVRLVGFMDEHFWRPRTTLFEVEGRAVEGVSMLQLFLKQPGGAFYEVLVVYPPDGYWRARPFPPAQLQEASYGSSFLLGPMIVKGRPIVDLRRLAFDPATLTFTLTFADGGSARLAIADASAERLALEVRLDAPIAGAPFAALRSMYVTEFNADAARMAWRAPGAAGWGEAPLMTFPGGAAFEVWTGRLVPSRHNTSAPDMTFGPFDTVP